MASNEKKPRAKKRSHTKAQDHTLQKVPKDCVHEFRSERHHLTRIRSNYWVFQEIDAIFWSNQVAAVWAISGFLIHLLDFEDGSESHPNLDVVLHRKLVWMRAKAQCVVFRLLL